MMPPLAPPKGMLTTAHFHVIHVASARTSSMETSGKADSTFAGAANSGMKNAISSEDFQRAIVHTHRNVQRDFFARVFEIPVQALLETQLIGRNFKTRFRVLVDIHFFRCGRLRHETFSSERRSTARHGTSVPTCSVASFAAK